MQSAVVCTGLHQSRACCSYYGFIHYTGLAPLRLTRGTFLGETLAGAS